MAGERSIEMAKAKVSLTREQILQAQDIKIEEVYVELWGGSVFVEGMTGTERDAFEAAIVSTKGKNVQTNMTNIRAKLVSLTACDAEGNKLFTPADTKVLGAKSAAALQLVFDVACRLSGIGQKDVEELAEGLEKDPFDASPSDSP